MRALLSVLALLVGGLMVGMLALLVIRGVGGLTPEFLFTMPRRAGQEGGVLPAVLSTAWLAAGALAIAMPLGTGTALFFVEYAHPGTLVGWMRSLIEVLAGVPSILFGLFGFSLFVVRLGWGPSILAGSLTLALMLLPTIIRTSEEALLAVPPALREGAAALGATRWQTIRHVVLRQAAPGILTGSILALGRAVGESAAVLLTAGIDLRLPLSPLEPGRPLAVHLYILAGEGLGDGQAYAIALALAASAVLFNLVATSVIRKGMSR